MMTEGLPPAKKLLVFLSYANEDKRKVRGLYKRLVTDGFDPWLDEERLLPGQDWDLEIKKALRASDAILLCFSQLSVSKEGYIQREYKRAMRYQEEKPEGTIFVIPVRLDECEIPYSYRGLHYVDYPESYDRLVAALNVRAGKEKSEKAAPAPQKKPGKRAATPKKPAGSSSGDDGGPTYNFNGPVQIMGKFVGRDDYNTYYGNQTTNINSPNEFAAALQVVQAQIAVLQQQADLTAAQRQEVQNAGEQVAEAVQEAGQPEPDGEHIQDTLQGAKQTMDSLAGSIGSAVGLGTTLASLIAMAMKFFGG
ncbi:MAG: toll/interleukin-1 receptor domain-containing protein [Anaerolineaceae bacterium]|nr:toll/interleukin-1 receptor domain-containing protein [Anaerolineaceae bacterium]